MVQTAAFDLTCGIHCKFLWDGFGNWVNGRQGSVTWRPFIGGDGKMKTPFRLQHFLGYVTHSFACVTRFYTIITHLYPIVTPTFLMVTSSHLIVGLSRVLSLLVRVFGTHDEAKGLSRWVANRKPE